MSKVTIVTATNPQRHDLLKRAVASVLAQTYSNWEYLIISDGADPEVEAYVASLRDKRIKYGYVLKTEYYGNLQRNYALLFATGEYICGLDDDNIMFPNYLEKLIACFDKPEIGYAICSVKFQTDFMNDEKTYDLVPKLPMKSGDVDTLCYMVTTSLARKVGGWQPVDLYDADFHFIDRVVKVSDGRIILDVLGLHGYVHKVKHAESERSTVLEKVAKEYNLKYYPEKSREVNLNRMIYQMAKFI